ncbi:MAG: head decoration protein [Oscillospiraceae bacterium]
MINLSEKLGEMTFDGLITDIKPAPEVRGGVIRKLSAAATLKRGTILAKSSGTAGDGKLVVLGSTAVKATRTLTPDCILCDDIDVGTAADEKVAVYTAGCFDIGKVTVSASYTITEGDKDNLRMRGIVFKAAAAAN